MSVTQRDGNARLGRGVSGPRHEDGFTLVETSLTVLIMAIVLAVAFPAVPLFFSQQTSIQNTFGAVDQLVLASETVTRFVHEAVDAAPAAPATPFLSASSNAVTFTTNTGKPTGPEEAVVQVTNAAGGGRKFGLSLIPANAASCPPCVYTGSATDLVLINYLTNGTGGSPVFSYLLQGGQSCAGAPPGAAPTTLSTALTNGNTYTQLSVAGLPKAVGIGDSIFIGSGPSAQLVSATAVTSAGAGTKVITVGSFTASSGYASGTRISDSAWGPVPANLGNTLSGPGALTSGTNVTSLKLASPLASAVATGDSVVVGTGATTQAFTAAAPGAAIGTSTIPVTSLTANSNYASGTSVYDSSCSATQLTQITAVSLNLQATKNPGGQPTGYQTLAYLLSPAYNASVG